MIPLRNKNLFDLTQTNAAEIFEEGEYPWEILPVIGDFLTYILGRADGYVRLESGSFVRDDVVVGEGTTIADSVVIEGPAIIGRNCEIRHGAFLRGNVIVGDDCVIGNSTEIKNSILFHHVTVPHFNYIGDSILGARAHCGSGAVLSNSKTPPSEIILHTSDGDIPTGLMKMGAMIGDDAEIGSNAVLNPGTIVGRRSIVYALAVVRGIIPSDTILKIRQQQEMVARR